MEQCPSLEIAFSDYALCTMHYALCTMHYALCTMDYGLWTNLMGSCELTASCVASCVASLVARVGSSQPLRSVPSLGIGHEQRAARRCVSGAFKMARSFAPPDVFSLPLSPTFCGTVSTPPGRTRPGHLNAPGTHLRSVSNQLLPTMPSLVGGKTLGSLLRSMRVADRGIR